MTAGGGDCAARRGRCGHTDLVTEQDVYACGPLAEHLLDLGEREAEDGGDLAGQLRGRHLLQVQGVIHCQCAKALVSTAASEPQPYCTGPTLTVYGTARVLPLVALSSALWWRGVSLLDLLAHVHSQAGSH